MNYDRTRPKNILSTEHVDNVTPRLEKLRNSMRKRAKKSSDNKSKK